MGFADFRIVDKQLSDKAGKQQSKKGKNIAEMDAQEKNEVAKQYGWYDMDGALRMLAEKKNKGQEITGDYKDLNDFIAGKANWDKNYSKMIQNGPEASEQPKINVNKYSTATRDAERAYGGTITPFKTGAATYGGTITPAGQAAGSTAASASRGSGQGAAKGQVSTADFRQTDQGMQNMEKLLAANREKDRVRKRKELQADIKTLTGQSMEDFAQKTLAIMKREEEIGTPSQWPKEYLWAKKLLENSDPELFIASEDERKQFYKDMALVGGARSGAMLGLDEVLGKGKNLTSDEVKEYAMKGLPVGYSILPDGAGGWRLASVQETNQISQEQNPGAFIAGNILGSIPTTIATGGTVSAGAKALGAGAKVARALGSGTVNAVRGFSDSMSRGDNAGQVILNTLGNGVIGGLGEGFVSPWVSDTVAGKLKGMPNLVKAMVSRAAGSVGYAGTDIAGRALINAATGKETDWGSELANIPANIALDLVLGGRYKDMDLKSGAEDVKIGAGKETNVDPEIAKVGAENAVNNADTYQRPSWRQSEIDAANDLPDYKSQVSFKKMQDGTTQEVKYGTKGSVRPDYYKTGYSIDIKNYDITSISGRTNLAKNIEKQYYQRIENLPKATKQTVVIDIRGQSITDEMLDFLHNDINGRTKSDIRIIFKSN